MTVESQVTVSDRLRRYIEAWADPDPVTIRNLYLDDGTHRGPGVALFFPDRLDSTLRGAEAISGLAAASREAMGDLDIDFTITSALEDASVSAVEYDVGDGDMRFAEIITWGGENVRQVHVYTLTGIA
jgi:hypothetical protein